MCDLWQGLTRKRTKAFSLFCSSVQQIFIMYLHARYCSWHWGCRSEQDGEGPCPAFPSPSSPASLSISTSLNLCFPPLFGSHMASWKRQSGQLVMVPAMPITSWVTSRGPGQKITVENYHLSGKRTTQLFSSTYIWYLTHSRHSVITCWMTRWNSFNFSSIKSDLGKVRLGGSVS